MKPLHWLIVLLTASLFGSSFLFIKLAVQEVPPLTLAAARVVLAAIAMTGVLYAVGGRLPALGRNWFPLLVLGVLTAAVPYAAISWGQERIEASLGGILFATIPIFTVVIAPMVTQETRLTGVRLAGVGVAFAGVLTTLATQAFNTLEIGGVSEHLAGAGATLLAAFCYAIGNIYARIKTGINPMVMASGQLITGSLVLLPIALLIDPPLVALPGDTALYSTLALSLLSTAAPVLMMFWLVRNAGATNASVLAFFIPVASVLLGTIVLHESLATHEIAGFALILLGALASTGTFSRLITRTA
jgi:drug/metabolite transporter (DMT)-like permease